MTDSTDSRGWAALGLLIAVVLSYFKIISLFSRSRYHFLGFVMMVDQLQSNVIEEANKRAQ